MGEKQDQIRPGRARARRVEEGLATPTLPPPDTALADEVTSLHADHVFYICHQHTRTITPRAQVNNLQAYTKLHDKFCF